MNGSGLNFQDDPNVNFTKLSGRIKNHNEKIETLEETIFGNGREGIKDDVANIKRDIQEINTKLDETEKRNEENQLSKKEKRGAMLALALVVLGAWLPNLIALLK
jgi:uncharacterized protein YydD (DUF2326 family)